MEKRKMKRNLILVVVFLLAALGPALAETGEAPKTLEIRQVKVVNDIYADVSLEYPKDWEDLRFQLQVDGRDVNARPLSAGFTEDRKSASLIFFPGKPGVKEISVNARVGEKTVVAKTSLKWGGSPFAALLDYPGSHLLVTEKRKVRIVTANVEDATIIFNGEPTNPKVMGREARFYSIDPMWRPGLNTVSIDGRGPDGTPVSRSYTFVFAPGGIVQGETMLLDYGSVETKSGPFYSVAVEGDAIVAGGSRMVDSYAIDKEGWIGREIRLVRELKAVKPGQTKVVISEKPHFLQEEHLLKEIVLTVTPAGQKPER
jgi:hypothetical protein